MTIDVPPRQIQFDKSGTVLGATLLNVRVIDTFRVNAACVAGMATVNKTADPLPFVFAVDDQTRLALAEIVKVTIPPSDGTFRPVAVVPTYSPNTIWATLTIAASVVSGVAAS